MSGEENTGFDFFVNYEGEVFLGKWFKRFVLRCSLINCYCEDARKFLNEKQRRLQKGD